MSTKDDHNPHLERGASGYGCFGRNQTPSSLCFAPPHCSQNVSYRNESGAKGVGNLAPLVTASVAEARCPPAHTSLYKTFPECYRGEDIEGRPSGYGGRGRNQTPSIAHRSSKQFPRMLLGGNLVRRASGHSCPGRNQTPSISDWPHVASQRSIAK